MRVIKLFIILAVGLLIGWSLGYTRPTTKKNDEVTKFLSNMEWDDSKAANFAVKAIPAIESGDREKAVALLALPIGSWYRVYSERVSTNEDRLRLKRSIEELAGTNAVVASAIHKRTQ